MFILKKIKSEYEEDFKLKYVGKFNVKLLVLTICIMSAYYLWYHSSIGIVTDKIPMPKFIEKGFENLTANPYSAVISIMIWGPIFEEILMRGIILEGFLDKYKPWKAIVASAVIFGAIHFNITQFINATLIGIIFGVIYYKTRSLLLCIIGHMLNNTLAFIVDYTNFAPNLISFTIGIIIFILAVKVSIKYINKITDHKENFEVESALKNIS
jgi:membrane protease YdiL (CAAX protease family)